MGPPNDGRPGFSRRAQYSIFAGYVLAAGGAIIGLVLLAVALAQPAAFSDVRSAATAIVEPIGEASAAIRRGSRGLIANLAGYLRAGSRNADLERELGLARAKLVQAAAIRAENARLKAVLGIAQREGPPVAVSHLIGSTAASSRRFATIDAGSNQGVAVGQPVRSATGMVGRVLEVGPTTARLLLISDAASVVPVRRARDGVAAFAQGRADGLLDLRLIDLGPNPLRVGDVMVTSGSGGLYRPNIPVAVVTELTRDGARGKIVSDPAATDFVIVEVSFAAAQQPSVPRATPFGGSATDDTRR